MFLTTLLHSVNFYQASHQDYYQQRQIGHRTSYHLEETEDRNSSRTCFCGSESVTKCRIYYNYTYFAGTVTLIELVQLIKSLKSVADFQVIAYY